MNAYKFNTRISNNGTITLPYEPSLYNLDADVFIFPKQKAIEISDEENRFSANSFINKWRGCIKGMENITD